MWVKLRKFLVLIFVGTLTKYEARAIPISDLERSITLAPSARVTVQFSVVNTSHTATDLNPEDESAKQGYTLEEVKALLNKSAVYSWAAYNSGVDEERWDLRVRKQLVELHSEYDSKSLSIFTYENREGMKPLITIAFPGTESLQDIFSYPHNRIDYPDKGKPAVSIGVMQGAYSGFLDRYLSFRNRLIQKILELIKANVKIVSDVNFLITGHSLGGGLATLCASDIKFAVAPSSEVDLVTFASPLVLAKNDAISLENRLNYVLRVVREGDIVQRINDYKTNPLGSFKDIRHVGPELVLKAVSSWNFVENHSMKYFLEDALQGKIPIPSELLSVSKGEKSK